MAKKPPSSSPATIGATFSQFYVALERCFSLKLSESVFIEIDGDVSIVDGNIDEMSEDKQIEVKEFFKPLTDSHKNFWNTLHNWMHSTFNHTTYSQLLLVTTQKLGAKSKFLNWNTKSKDERYKILEKIYLAADRRFKKEMLTESKKPDSKTLVPPKPFAQMKDILSSEHRTKLMEVLDKVVIITEHPKRDKFAIELAERELKTIPDFNRLKVLSGLLGFVVNSEAYNKGWKVTNKDFQQALQDIANRYMEQSILFPPIEDYTSISEEETEGSLDYPFVKKIQDIEYHDVVTDSVSEYWFTTKFLSEEFSRRASKKTSIILFQDNIKRQHKPAYRLASSNCEICDLIHKSQNFFDNMMTLPSQKFDVYSDTPQLFRNGMYHILANDDEHDIHWKLKPKGNE